MAKSSRGSSAATAAGVQAGITPSDAAAAAEVAALSYEDALAELEALVQQVEDGSLSLEAGIQAHRRAILLLKHCESILNAAQSQVEEIAGRDLPPAPDENE